MTSKQKAFLTTAMAAVLGALAPAAYAQTVSGDVVRLGVLTDMSGIYSDISGTGAVEAARMAIEDHGDAVLGKPIELVSADHQNKGDVGSARAREWYDGGVDAIFEMMASSVALAVFEVATEKEKVAIAAGAASSALTNENCSPFGAHWVYDTHALAAGTARTLATQPDSNSWYFITVDYAFGHALESDSSAFVTSAGGQVAGSVRHPIGAPDFGSYLLQAQSSGAQVVALANGGADMVNSLRQAGEFGIVQSGQKLVALLPHLTDINAVGLETAQGLLLTEGFYWDRTDETREWSRRFFERHGAMPTMVQAGVYSSVLHYLKAIDAAGTDEAAAVMEKMRELPINDMFATNGLLRIDGRMVHDMYVVQVKSPQDAQYPWDYYEILHTIPGDEAFRPLEESACRLVEGN
ncbi:ABC transporter substrate-binding protein [Mesorhizobium sp. CAU 1732]|uniref:ABC transporter substrate-binding protein n=1 Tax=Mesorhizobium sp. CAU 1732 TaxID=3140358 RepID=UPI003260C2A0